MPRARDREDSRPVSPLELVASTLGMVLTFGMIAFIAWEALTRPGDVPPVVTVEPLSVSRSDDLWVLEFEARNLSPQTAASVVIVGTLTDAGRPVATGRTVLDYVPGKSRVRGGLFFPTDPASHDLELHAVGYAEP